MASEKGKTLLTALLDALLAYEQIHGTRKRRRRPEAFRVFSKIVEALACDLIHAVLTGRG
jgi:DNA polymerase II large subunit